MCTASDYETTKEYFDNLNRKDYARSGFKATTLVTLPAGPLEDKPHSMLEEFRKLGLPVDLNKGTIVMRKEYVVCRPGQVLTPEQCRILKHFDIFMAEFKLSVRAMYHDGEVTVYEAEEGEEEEEENVTMEEDEEEQ